ncbi:TPA: hypothetical protein PXF07_002498 [Mannheimia haemolytica]|uniref:Uncharacterized protein n=3 Tax=Mannheimia haemolytica TaxID=75985 RepID=A0A547E9F3_MANHA|nr:hypothetical protein [Mannheimia haemolytica]YP_009213791.1 hypothetical protein AVV62_gp33 [Mannheimia phage vB_MhS_1152AP2]AJA73400.1 hypothetical protein 3927AP1_36 [Mannheimia phage vB_MhS_3927AP1]AGK02199.1 putative exonuclease [Mannheimia haemolytica M42548]AJA73318.1 hypothetical protein 1152AP2_33 [Mannheimia phage vB_MhS_1152AP2]ASW36119.1 hypothetical protein CKG23_05500 [Mannheimia haemolytica]ASW65941.1 hypothetical protein CKG22_05845 [Mannheimia haemolytica]
MHIEDKIAWWLANGETGVSSKTMAFYLGYGIRPKIEGYPHDVSDFRRCFLLLETVPFLRNRIEKMAELGKVWAALAKEWHTLEALYNEEEDQIRCPKTYAKLREILEANEENVVRIGNVSISIGSTT